MTWKFSPFVRVGSSGCMSAFAWNKKAGQTCRLGRYVNVRHVFQRNLGKSAKLVVSTRVCFCVIFGKGVGKAYAGVYTAYLSCRGKRQAWFSLCRNAGKQEVRCWGRRENSIFSFGVPLSVPCMVWRCMLSGCVHRLCPWTTHSTLVGCCG